jgi:hypothetical protein
MHDLLRGFITFRKNGFRSDVVRHMHYVWKVRTVVIEMDPGFELQLPAWQIRACGRIDMCKGSLFHNLKAKTA